MKFSEVCIFKGVTAYIHILQVLIDILLAKFQKAPAYMMVLKFCKLDKLSIAAATNRQIPIG